MSSAYNLSLYRAPPSLRAVAHWSAGGHGVALAESREGGAGELKERWATFELSVRPNIPGGGFRMGFLDNLRLKARHAKRVGAFAKAKQLGMSETEARRYADELYPQTPEDVAYELEQAEKAGRSR